MNSKKYEFLIVGSGAGGATLTRELSKKAKKVLVVEKGKYEQKLGTFQDCLRSYDANKLTKLPKKIKGRSYSVQNHYGGRFYSRFL